MWINFPDASAPCVALSVLNAFSVRVQEAQAVTGVTQLSGSWSWRDEAALTPPTGSRAPPDLEAGLCWAQQLTGLGHQC